MLYFLRRALFVYFRPYWKQCLLLFLCIAITISFETVFPLSVKFLIDLAITPQNHEMLILLIGGLGAFYLISTLGALSLDYLNAHLVAQVMRNIRMKMFSHLQYLSASYYARLQSEDVITRFNTDLKTIETALTFSVIQGIQFGLQLVLNVIVLFLLDVPLAVITILFLSVTAFLPKLFIKRATLLAVQRRTEETDIASKVLENLQAQSVVRMFGLREPVIAAFARQANRFAVTSRQSTFAEWLVSRTTYLGQYLIQSLVIAIGGLLVFFQRLSIGSLVGFTSLLASLGNSVTLVLDAFTGLIPALVSLDRVERLLRESSEVHDSPGKHLPRFTNQITFEQVTFSYDGPEGMPAVKQIDLSIPRGETAAVVGRSGSGKSTLLNLLMRFYDPDQGRILIDGQDIRQVSLASLRSQMAVVFQDTFLFDTTLRENIRMGKLGASDAEVEEAAKAAGIHETILSLPGGYETRVGEQGKALSGGQRQRIALARAIIHRPAILLLDEATSALDPETEQLIYETLKKLKGSCTILLVTHRLAPASGMGQIIVLDNGQVAEVGNHETLLMQQGIYYRLYMQQNGFTVSADGLYAEITPARLRSIPLFAQLDDTTLEILAPQFIPEWYEAGSTVIREGDLGEKFYIIVRGKVSVTIAGLQQQMVHLGFWQDGDYFGEIALLDGGRRTATVRTILPCLFLTLDRKHFMNMMASSLSVRKDIEQAARMRRFNQRMP